MIQRTLLLFSFTLWVVKLNAQPSANIYNVVRYGAKNDGKTVTSEAINRTIDEAAKAGGGTVYFPAGNYLSFSIHLKSNISLYFDQGANLISATPSDSLGFYDEAEPNIWGDSLKYQDFGHSHWHNSLIWGENLENISILGPGLIDGRGLVRFGSSKAKTKELIAQAAAVKPLTANDSVNMNFLSMKGLANKAIALKLCHNVTIRDISILNGGHFAILATGVDNFTLDNLKVDSNRDGIDIDACNNVRVSNCSINVPWDDGLCLKASFALGYVKHCENITITNCYLSGFDRGSMLSGKYLKGPDQNKVPDKGGAFGRIKLGTESNGDFRNISITNCVCENSRGVALESMDGSNIEDITISNITMRDANSSPIFMRIGNRMRGPKDLQIGHIRRISISNLIAYNANADYCTLISGIPGHDIEDIKLDNIRIWYAGGGTKEQAALVIPEKEKEYPDPQMFGILPAYGLFVRHAKNVSLSNFEVYYQKDEQRPAFYFEDVKGLNLLNVKAMQTSGVETYVLKNVSDLSSWQCNGLELPKNKK